MKERTTREMLDAHTLLQHMIDDALGDYMPQRRGRSDIDRKEAVASAIAEIKTLREALDQLNAS